MVARLTTRTIPSHRVVGPTVLVFAVSFVCVTVLTVWVMYTKHHRPESDTIIARSSSLPRLPPFPNIAPLVAAPPAAPSAAGRTVCAQFVGNAAGKYIPSPADALRPCDSDADCASCSGGASVCVDTAHGDGADVYSDVAHHQAALGGGGGTKFCLPPPKQCLPTVAQQAASPWLAPMPCTHTSDCAPCVDPNLERGDPTDDAATATTTVLTCQTVTHPVTMVSGSDTVNVPPGRFCMPATTPGCHPDNGTLVWTTDGWTCQCKYPGIFGGAACDVMVACNRHLTSPESRAHQNLLLNTPTPPGVDPTPWTPESGVNPTLCHEKGVTDTSKWNRVCTSSSSSSPSSSSSRSDDPACTPTSVSGLFSSHGNNPNTTGVLVPNVVCQCDGLMAPSNTAFTYDPYDGLTCVPDNCSVNAAGGRTGLIMNAWSADPDVPPNSCVCSGADATLYAYSQTDGFTYTGPCRDTVVPGSDNITVWANTQHAESQACATTPNTNPVTTGLVPGKAVDAQGVATIDVCSTDPCRGRYTDNNFIPPHTDTFFGHYDAAAGTCACVSPSATVDVDDGICDHTVNPVCKTCVNACVNDPCRDHVTRPCLEKIQCTTNSNGLPVCKCPAGCGNTDGMTCAKQFTEADRPGPGSGVPCNGFVGVPNMCEPGLGECRCHKAESKDNTFASCEDKEFRVAMCTESDAALPSCHTGGSSDFGECAGSSCPQEYGKGCFTDQQDHYGDPW